MYGILPVVLPFIYLLTEVWTAGIPCRMTIWTRSLTCTTGALVKTCPREEPTDTGEWDLWTSAKRGTEFNFILESDIDLLNYEYTQ